MEVADHEALTIADFPEAPEWFQRYLEATGKSEDVLTRALQGNLTLAHNLHAELWEGELRHDTEDEIRLQSLRGKPLDAILSSHAAGEYPLLNWRVIDESLVAVKVKWATDPGVTVKCRIWFMGA